MHIFFLHIFRYAARHPVKEINRKVRDENNDNNDDPGFNDQNIARSPANFISCHELKQRMEQSPNDMLLVDCRPAAEFAKSTLAFKNIINIPDESIKKGYELYLLQR